MKLLILAVCVCVVRSDIAGESPTTVCPNCVKLDTACYNFTHVFNLEANFRTDVVISKMLIYTRKNILYFSYEPQYNDPEYYRVRFVDLDNPERGGDVPPLADRKQAFNFGTFDIDQINGIMYMGGSDGIYQVNLANVSDIKSYSYRGDYIDKICIKGNVYFTVRKSEDTRLFQKSGDLFIQPNAFEGVQVNDFLIDKSGTTYYVGASGTYAQRGAESVRLTVNNFIRGMTVDRNDDIYMWWLDGIYKVKKQKKLSEYSLVKVFDVDSITSMTFDKDNNILLAFGKGLFKMTKTDVLEC